MLNRLAEWYKALRRGERRIAPYGNTGRVYEREAPDYGDKSGGKEFKAVATPTLTARVIRANGTVEEL